MVDLLAFPQQWADEFWYAKGVVSLTATCLLVWHMQRKWPNVTSRPQRMRYLTLLYFAVFITAVSVDQVSRGALVTWQNLAAFLGAGLLLVTAGLSLRDEP